MNARFYFLSLLVLLFVFTPASAQIKPPPKVVYGEFLNDKAITLSDPVYPAAAKAVRATGAVNVQVTMVGKPSKIERDRRSAFFFEKG